MNWMTKTEYQEYFFVKSSQVLQPRYPQVWALHEPSRNVAVQLSGHLGVIRVQADLDGVPDHSEQPLVQLVDLLCHGACRGIS
jgi:hypothetical protein